MAIPYQLSQLLYACRWIGTLLVLVVHAEYIFIGPDAFTYQKWLCGAYALGRIALIGFFVMSGFLVGGTVLSYLRAPRGFLKHYFIHRFARIYLVLVPAIIITALVDGVGRAIFKDYSLYSSISALQMLGPCRIVMSLLNLQGIVIDSYGTNGPLWSLAYEFWFYIIFPLLFLPFVPAYSRIARVVAFIFGLALSVILSVPHKLIFSELFLSWLLGAAVSIAPQPILRSKWLSATIYLCIIYFLVLAWCFFSLMDGHLLPASPARIQAISDIVSALFFANLILTLQFDSGDGWGLLKSPLHKFLADFSFTIYSIHNPILHFSRATADYTLGDHWIEQYGKWFQWTLILTVVTIIVLISFCLSLVTENKVGRTRRFLLGVDERIRYRLHVFVRSPAFHRPTPSAPPAGWRAWWDAWRPRTAPPRPGQANSIPSRRPR